jgi:hypothetical protein
VVERGRPAEKVSGRREACYFYRPPARSTGRGQADEIGTRFSLELVSDLRDRVRAWRERHEGVTGVTGELLAYWVVRTASAASSSASARPSRP